MSDPIKAVATGAVLAEANQKQAPAVKPRAPTEFVILVRHPEKRTLHAVLNPKAGVGVIAVFETPELASVQASTIPSLQNKEYYIIPVE